MKYKRPKILFIFPLLIALLVLGGCTIHNDTLDAQMQKIITALNEKDTDTLRQMLPDDGIEEEQFLSDVEQLYSIWTPMDPSEARLIQLNVTKSPEQTVIRGIYSVPETSQYNCVQLISVEPKGESAVLNNFNVGWVNSDTADHSPLNIIGIALSLISFAVIVFTIVDIARKRPKKYGWYIVLALFTFFLSVNGVRLTAPVGAIIYWCIRGSLLQKKAAEEAEKQLGLEPPAVIDEETIEE